MTIPGMSKRNISIFFTFMSVLSSASANNYYFDTQIQFYIQGDKFSLVADIGNSTRQKMPKLELLWQTFICGLGYLQSLAYILTIFLYCTRLQNRVCYATKHGFIPTRKANNLFLSLFVLDLLLTLLPISAQQKCRRWSLKRERACMSPD